MDAFEAISLPESSSLSSRKFFSVAEANRSLVLVRRIVADIVAEYRRLRELHDTCLRLDSEGDVAAAEKVRGQYAAATDRLAALREELEEVGCELKDYGQGLVDFPARLKDRAILLCWKYDEESVDFWHEADAGFAGRQPIASLTL